MKKPISVLELESMLDGLDFIKVDKVKVSVYYGMLRDTFRFTQAEVISFAEDSVIIVQEGYIHIVNYSKFEEWVIVDERVRERVLLFYYL